MAYVDFGRYKRVVKYFWDPEPINDVASSAPICCLGTNYASASRVEAPVSARIVDGLTEESRADYDDPGIVHLPENNFSDQTSISGETRDSLRPQEGRLEDRGWPSDFLDDFESRFWFTYRSQFPLIHRSTEPSALASMSLSARLRSQLVDQAGFTSDTGWGCMIRSGQCLLANALAILRFGRDWRRGARAAEERRLLAMFADDPHAPFSLHKFVEYGAMACGKYPGEWFGPSATARCIQALSENYPLSGLRVYVTGDGSEVYEDVLLGIAQPDGGIFHPTLILIGIRLGIDRVTPVYWEALKSTLKMPQSIGIAGGRPSSSHYFVGVQGNNVFYLDPHQTRPALPWHEDSDDYSIEDVDSCHTRRLRRLSIGDMDPSMLIAFLIRNKADWQTWRQSIARTSGKPVVRVADTESSLYGHGAERLSAVDEVETFDDDEDESIDNAAGDVELGSPPNQT